LQTVRAYEQEQVRAATWRYLLRHPLRFVGDRRVLLPQLTQRFSGEQWYG
jgi:hypothetical protein